MYVLVRREEHEGVQDDMQVFVRVRMIHEYADVGVVRVCLRHEHGEHGEHGEHADAVHVRVT